ncbi:hypothetical protein AVEN_162791-1 [Araneus ventricosus]|uniref:Uncharacterized protein n=1 Tax=Araneus ventricosus TaxID=182803 RepID=A0A4Y2C8X1_ARAVE|nr:hypothetical protein AVEN_162791-1 [Araneus ventricosus]
MIPENATLFLIFLLGNGIHEKTPCDVTACRRECLRTALRSEERLYRLGSPWSTNAFGVLPAVRAAEARRKPSGISRRCGATNEPGLRRVPSGCPRQPSSQYFVDAIIDEDTRHATRLMDGKDLKSAFAYSMKYEAAKTVSKTSRNARSIEVEDGTGKENDEKFDCLLKTLEKLLNSHVAGKKNTPRRNPNVTC